MSHQLPRSPFATRLSGSARETELRLRNIFQWKKQRPPVVLIILTALTVLLCCGLVSCQPSREEPNAPEDAAEAQSPDDIQEPPEAEPAQTSELKSAISFAEHLNLDGVGTNDDSMTVTTRRIFEYLSDGLVEVCVQLGTGQEVQWESTLEGYCSCRAIHTACLTSAQKQTVILELVPAGANWTPADYILLEVGKSESDETIFVERGRMTSGENDVDPLDALIPMPSLWGLEVIDREDSDLQALRVPTYAGKWHAPEWGTLTWEDGQWNYVSDGYFTDTETVTVDGGLELTLALRGRTIGESPYQYYDQLQIFHGGTLLQTITEDSFTPDGHCRFQRFNADYPLHTVDIRDINFDGSEDFGISCSTTRNNGHCWFLYDAETRQFRYAFSLSGTPTILPETGQIVEEWQDDNGESITYNTYEYDSQGKLTLVDSRKEGG
ncbi:MAG: XAC2610-related protein [Oscillospiraceae bacterium]